MRLTYLTYCPRSGSTKLAQMLADACFVVPEFRSPILLAERGGYRRGLTADEILACLRADRQIGSNLGLDDRDLVRIADLAESDPAPSVLAAVISVWCERNDTPTPAEALVKLGRMVDHGDDVLSGDDSSGLVHLVRDPRAVVRSMLRSRPPRSSATQDFAFGDPLFAARLWRSRVLRYERLACDHPTRTRLVRFEDLANGGTLDGVRSFIGRSGDAIALRVPNVEQSLHRDVDKPLDVASHNELWRRELEPGVIHQIEVICHEHMLRYGYAVDRAPTSADRLEVALRSAIRTPRRTAMRIRERWGRR